MNMSHGYFQPKLFLFLVSLLTIKNGSNLQAHTATTGDEIELSAITLKNQLVTLTQINPDVHLKKEISELSNHNDEFTLEELYSICKSALQKINHIESLAGSPQEEALTNYTLALVKELKNYKVQGVGFADHASTSFIFGQENYNTKFYFKNEKTQDLASKNFKLDYSSVGLQGRFTYRFDLIFVVNSNLNRFNTREPIKLNTGFSIGITPAIFSHNPHVFSFPGLAVAGTTIIPFADQPGALYIIHFGLGFVIPSIEITVISSGGSLSRCA